MPEGERQFEEIIFSKKMEEIIDKVSLIGICRISIDYDGESFELDALGARSFTLRLFQRK